MAPSRVPEGETRGHIVPIGGAENKENDPKILARFVQVSGGGDADIVVIPTASRAHGTGERVQHAQHHALRAEVPADVRVPEPLMNRRVRIELRVGVLVMIAMIARPLDRRARGKAERDQRAFEPPRHPERSVRQHAVVAQVHAEPGQLVVRDREEGKRNGLHQKFPISSSCSAYSRATTFAQVTTPAARRSSRRPRSSASWRRLKCFTSLSE